ncbi:MAG: hypothetical protein HXS52_11500 [Theionarchaea archaeon]|nr:hypothetical protein [Theionarchaea archaeon]MBU7038546.1 hypothetical protein [Theionarchaea archaeon]
MFPKDVVLAESKANQEADKTVLEIDDAVRECAAVLDSGKIPPSVSDLVRDASGLVRDASGLVRDASGLVRDASGLVRGAPGSVPNQAIAQKYKDMAKKARLLFIENSRFALSMRRYVNLAKAGKTSDMVRDASGLVRDASGLVRDASGLVRDVSELMSDPVKKKDLQNLMNKADLEARADTLENRADNTKNPSDASGLVRDASGLVRDASGLVRDASGLVRDASGLVR